MERTAAVWHCWAVPANNKNKKRLKRQVLNDGSECLQLQLNNKDSSVEQGYTVLNIHSKNNQIGTI